MLLPGLLLDALLRGITCVLTATPIQRISPLGQDRPFMEVGESGMKYLGPPIALIVRTVGVIAGAYYLLLDRPDFLTSGFALPLLDQESLESGRTTETFHTFRAHLRQLPELLSAGAPGSMLLLYAFFAYKRRSGSPLGGVPRRPGHLWNPLAGGAGSHLARAPVRVPVPGVVHPELLPPRGLVHGLAPDPGSPRRPGAPVWCTPLPSARRPGPERRGAIAGVAADSGRRVGCQVRQSFYHSRALPCAGVAGEGANR